MKTNKENLICWNDLTEKQKADFFIKLQKLRKDENNRTDWWGGSVVEEEVWRVERYIFKCFLADKPLQRMLSERFKINQINTGETMSGKIYVFRDNINECKEFKEFMKDFIYHASGQGVLDKIKEIENQNENPTNKGTEPTSDWFRSAERKSKCLHLWRITQI